MTIVVTPLNEEATGAPAITGQSAHTAMVGETLSAGPGSVDDADGRTMADNGDAGHLAGSAFALTAQAGGTGTPSVEVGLRRDGGDAERGFGVDVGAGLGWSDRRRGLEAELRGRGLLTHEDGSFGERGISGSLSWDPRPGSGLGPTFTLSRSVGGSVTGGMDALLGRETMAGLAADDNGGELSRRLEATVGYGVPVFGGRFIGTPAVGIGLSDAGRELRVGWGVGLARREGTVSMDFEFEASRRESANDDREPEHGVGVRFSVRW